MAKTTKGFGEREKKSVVGGITGITPAAASEDKLKQRTYYTTDSQHKTLKIHAANQGIAVSDIVRDALNEYFENHKIEIVK